MKPNRISGIAYLLLIVFAFSACKKVININLNSASPRYVVEGNVTNQAAPYLVSITKSINFDQDNVYPTVSGATVVITDMTTMLADTLKEQTPGNYYTTITNGIPGHTYRLYVNAAGNIFTASSTMPPVVTLDSLYTQNSAFGDRQVLVPVYTDPAATGNYYHFKEVRNDTVTDAIQIRNDNLINGQVVKLPLNGGSDLKAGDSVTLYLETIDSAVYQYYYSLEQTTNQNSATPANPLSNISGGALGYFSAHTSSGKSILVQ